MYFLSSCLWYLNRVAYRIFFWRGEISRMIYFVCVCICNAATHILVNIYFPEVQWVKCEYRIVPKVSPPPKISPLPSLTHKFLHRYFCLVYKPPPLSRENCFVRKKKHLEIDRSAVIRSPNGMSLSSRVYKEGEGECRTAYILCVTAIRTVHDLCNDIHVWRSPWNVLALL
jgi:hypothetical protein